MGGQGIIPCEVLPPLETMKAKFVYTGIRVKDLEASVKFYTGLLGMKELDRSTIEAAKGTAVNLAMDENGHILELNYYEKGSPYATKYEVGEGLDHLCFRVEDLNAALAEAKRAGHPMVLEMKGTTSRWAYIKDPDGNWIELCQ
jgi:lactoylglutathione lyase